jgi:hypothetical protein
LQQIIADGDSRRSAELHRGVDAAGREWRDHARRIAQKHHVLAAKRPHRAAAGDQSAALRDQPGAIEVE